MNEQTIAPNAQSVCSADSIKELMEPIAAYINANQITYNDVHIIVQNLFPDEDKVRQIATYLNQNVPPLRALGLTDDKLFERTRQILTNALIQASLDMLYAKEDYDESVDYSDLDSDDFDDLDDRDWDDGDYDED